MSYDPNQVKTVIIGAGPIGLLNAIGLLTKNPNQKLVILEKYDYLGIFKHRPEESYSEEQQTKSIEQNR